MKKHWITAAALGMAVSLPALAQDKVKLVDVVELSGAGATAGTNWKNGIDLAVADINAKGGILGKQVEIVHYDTQTNPGNTRAAVQRGIDVWKVLRAACLNPVQHYRLDVGQLREGDAADFIVVTDL